MSAGNRGVTMNYFLFAGLLSAATLESLVGLTRSITAIRRVARLRQGRHAELLPSQLWLGVIAAICLGVALALVYAIVWLARAAGVSALVAVLTPVFWAEVYGLLLWWSPDVRRLASLTMGLSGRAIHAIRRRRVHHAASRTEVETVADSILRALYLRT